MIVLVLISAFYMVQSKMYVGISGAYTYDEGQAKCQSMGGHLATFDNWNDFNKIREVRRTIGGNGYAWIGMDDRGTEWHWRFIDGSTHYCAPVGSSTIDCDDIDMWSPNEPNDHGGNQDCALIWPHHGELLDDARCAVRYGFICEFQSGGCSMSDTELPVAPYIPSGNPNSNYILEITGFKGLVTVVSVALNLIAFISICWIVMKKKKPSPYSKVKMYATEEEPL
eukprot:283876_1